MSYSIYVRKPKVHRECAESQTQTKMSNSFTVGKQILAGVKGRVRSNSIYIENLKLVGSVQRVSNPDQKVKFNHYKETGSCGVKGRVRSFSFYIENLNLVGIVQRVSNPDQKVKFNHYKETGSSGVKGRVRSYSFYIENLKLVGVKGRGRACAFYYVRAQPTHPWVPAKVEPACLCARVDGRNHYEVRGG